MTMVAVSRGVTARWLAVVGLCLAGAAMPAARAQSSAASDDGIEIGPWVLAPYLVSSVSRDDNVFRRADERQVDPDTITTFTVGAIARLPFRASELELAYAGSQTHYTNTGALDQQLTQELDARLDLQFFRGDRLTLSERYTEGSSDVTQIDEAGELVFDGQPFATNNWEVELSRLQNGRRGYSMRLAGSTIRYDSPESTSFFDYDRGEVELQYREPVSPHSWIELSYRRLEEDEFRDVFRQERSQRLLVGLRGQLGKGNATNLRIGLESVDLDESGTLTSFDGFVGAGDWSHALGSGGRLTLGFNRQVQPSFFDTYFVVSGLQARFEHRWPSRMRAGGSIRIWENRYGDPLDWRNTCAPDTPPEQCPGAFSRTDDQGFIEGFLAFVPHARVEVLLSVNRQRRESNFEPATYESTVFGLSLAFGWKR